MAEAVLRATPVFQRNWEGYHDPRYRFLVNQGGSRSSKSFSIVQILVILAHQSPITVSVVRKTMPSLKASILRDFEAVMRGANLWQERRFNRTESTYRCQNGSVFEFFSVDDEQKVRGRKRDVLFCNEANELDLEEFNQLMLRTSGKCFIDFNPSDPQGWVYDWGARKDSLFIKSTYLDNPFLPKEQVDYITSLREVDPGLYQVYTLGERRDRSDRVYTHFTTHREHPGTPDRTVYGLDLGYNDPTVLVRVDWVGDVAHVRQLLWEPKLTATDLVERIHRLEVRDTVWSDHRPEVIEELRRAGLDVRAARKDILAGIERVRATRVSVHEGSLDLLREHRTYRYRADRTGQPSDGVPLDRENHGMDALRYAIVSSEGADGPPVWFAVA